jgi:hypothetical protein
MIRVAAGSMVQYECQSCHARTVQCKKSKRFAQERRRKRNKFAVNLLICFSLWLPPLRAQLPSLNAWVLGMMRLIRAIVRSYLRS